MLKTTIAVLAALSLGAVSSTSTTASFTGNASTTAFAFSFPLHDATHLVVKLDGVTQASGYSVARNTDQTTNPGGTVTFSSAPGLGVAVQLVRQTPLTQVSAWSAYSPFQAKALERALDRGTLQVQEQARALGELDVRESSHYEALFAALCAATSACSPASPVIITPGSGNFFSSVSVTMLTSTPNATIYYTLDGSTPTTSSSVYEGAFSVTPPKSIAAIAVAPGLSPSDVSSVVYDQAGTWFSFRVPGCYNSPASLGGFGETLTFTRASNGADIMGGTTVNCTSGQARVADLGLAVEQNTTQQVTAPTAPTTETKSLSATNLFAAYIEGTGSMAIATAGATATGLPCTATAGSPCYFTVTGTGNVTWTITGGPSFAQISNLPSGSGQFLPTKLVTTGLRQNETASFTAPAAGTWSQGTMTWAPLWDTEKGPLTQEPILLSTGTLDTTGFALQYRTSTNRLRLNWNADNIDSQEGWFSANTTHEIGWRVSGTTACVYLDGIETCGTVAASSITPGANGYIGTSSAGNTSYSWSHFKDVRIGQSPAVSANSQSIAALGDSLTLGAACGTDPWPRKVVKTKGRGWTHSNYGVGGENTTQILARWPAIRANGHRKLTLLGGTNDINQGATAAATWANLKTITDQALADGWSVVLLTVPPSSIFTGGELTEWAALNASIRAYCATPISGLACADIEPTLNSGTNTLNPTYNSGDGVHINQAGCDYVASVVTPLFP